MIRAYADSRGARLLAGAAILVLMVLIIFSVSMLMRYQRYQAEIDSMLPRTAQLEGIYNAREQIRAAVGEAEQELAGYVYRGDRDDATLNSELQNRARSVFTGAGMRVSGSQILPLRPGESVTQLMLDLTATGSLESLESALQGLKEARPQILVDNLRIEPVRTTRNNQTQSVQVHLRLFVFREGGR